MNVHVNRDSSDQEQRRRHLRSNSTWQPVGTRSQLASAFRAAAESGVARLSVRMLCDTAGTARSTFYTHFSSVEDLAAFVITEDFDRLAAENLQRRSTGSAAGVSARIELQQMVELLRARRPLLTYAFAVTAEPLVAEEMVKWFARYLWEPVQAAYPARDEAHLKLIADFISAGMVRTVLGWLGATSPLSAEQLVDTLELLLPKGLR